MSYRRGCQPTACVDVDMFTKPACTGSCRPFSLMFCFLTHRFLHQIMCLKKSLNYLELKKIAEYRHSLPVSPFHIQSHSSFSSPVSIAQLFWLSLLLHCVISFPFLVSSPPSLSLPAFVLPFLLSSIPPFLCPQALVADCVMWRLNEAVLIQ